jgi:hypothetical protein
MKPTAKNVASTIHNLLEGSNLTRARISDQTVKAISQRSKLRIYFVLSLRNELDDLGIAFIELDRGGFGIIYAKALEGAKSLTQTNVLKFGQS